MSLGSNNPWRESVGCWKRGGFSFSSFVSTEILSSSLGLAWMQPTFWPIHISGET